MHKYTLVDDTHESFLDGQLSRFSISRRNGEHLAWVSGDSEIAQELIDALNAPAAAGPVVLPEPVAFSLGLAKYAHSSNIIAANEFTPDAEHADEWENLYSEQQVRALLARVSAPAALAGWKLVPEQDTPAMWTAGGKAIKACGGHERDAASLAYKAMLAAAPTAQVGGGDALKCADCGCPETSWCSCPDSPMNTKPGTNERADAIAAAKGE